MNSVSLICLGIYFCEVGNKPLSLVSKLVLMLLFSWYNSLMLVST